NPGMALPQRSVTVFLEIENCGNVGHEYSLSEQILLDKLNCGARALNMPFTKRLLKATCQLYQKPPGCPMVLASRQPCSMRIDDVSLFPLIVFPLAKLSE
ncbi:MAG: hypothetical protein KC418_19215, partial [Anaerolineales bacterium]|nr:hypothetical protein [Anaerolineales bacterium]